MRLRILQFAVFAGLVLLWHVFTTPGIVPPLFFERDNQAAFFFGEPVKIFWAIFDWFWTGEIFVHLGVTLLETALGFVIGAVSGLGIGLWLALSKTASAIMEPYIKGFNSMPRVVLAPIFAVWFGLGIWSKVALGVTLVFFVVFFNVYQGVREVSPCSPMRACWAPPSASCCARSICRRP
jgi:NitT/TauT family transport system permease protein